MYRVLAWLDPLIRAVWGRFGIGNIVEVRVPRRDGTGERSRMLGVLRAAGALYLGHPNGHVGWTRDLEAAGHARLTWPREAAIEVRAERLPVGDERTAAIRATTQHPFPGNVIYRLGRRHALAAGVYFRITPDAGVGGR